MDPDGYALEALQVTIACAFGSDVSMNKSPTTQTMHVLSVTPHAMHYTPF